MTMSAVFLQSDSVIDHLVNAKVLYFFDYCVIATVVTHMVREIFMRIGAMHK